MQDQDLTFYLCAYQDTALLRLCLQDLRRHYKSRTIVVSDGDPNPLIAEICAEFDTEFHAGDWLYGPQHGGQRHQRMLELFLKSPTSYLFKIDTDTKICGRFTALPTTPCCFGNRIHHFRPPEDRPIDEHIIQGGCIGYHLSTIHQLYNSEIFLRAELLDGVWRVATNNYPISEDQINHYCLKRLGIPTIHIPEVFSWGRGKALRRSALNREIKVLHPRSLVNFL